MYLGIDIGTSAIKAILLDSNGQLAGQSEAALSCSRPHALWSEQKPHDWWKAVNTAVCQLDERLRARVEAIGLAGQMHGATVLDASDRPLRPAILWNDGRSFSECDELEAAERGTRAITGNLAMPGFTAPKLLWLRKHEPDLFSHIRSVLLPKDYVRLCMTGDKASDLSDSAGTLWLDVAARRWSPAMLEATGLGIETMPQLHEGTEITGRLRASVAKAWGMRQVPVAAGAGDNAAGAVGVGVIRDGHALLSLGTSGVIFVATDEFRPNPGRALHSFCHCLPGRWHQMSVHLSAASCIDWAARIIGAESPAALFARAEASAHGGGQELFLPYLSGERTPHNDPHVRGAFVGLSHDTDGDRLAQAVLEGIAFALADGLDSIRTAGTRIAQLSVIGGGSRSAYWGKIIASALDVRLAYLAGGEVGPARGAARIAQVAATGADPAEIFAAPAITHIIEPDPDMAERLVPKRARFRSSYPLIRQIQE